MMFELGLEVNSRGALMIIVCEGAKVFWFEVVGVQENGNWIVI